MKIFSLFFRQKKRLDVSSESSARQKSRMKNQALFSSKDKSKTLKCRLLQFLFRALTVLDILYENTCWSEFADFPHALQLSCTSLLQFVVFCSVFCSLITSVTLNIGIEILEQIV